jgi:hypothetical protein
VGRGREGEREREAGRGHRLTCSSTSPNCSLADRWYCVDVCVDVWHEFVGACLCVCTCAQAEIWE